MSDNNSITKKDLLDSINLKNIDNTTKRNRGRPPKDTKNQSNTISVSNSNKQVNNDTEESGEEELILHLPITTDDINNVQYNKKPIIEVEQPYKTALNTELNENTVNLLNIINKLKEENAEQKRNLDELTPMCYTEIKYYTGKLNFIDTENNITELSKTDICCWWCTEKFDNYPVPLPTRYNNNTYNVMGCFCSFNCATAYNLNLNNDGVQERSSLLKRLYYDINKDTITKLQNIEINPSGPRELLKKFGGPMEIDVYRRNSKIIGKKYHISYPPLNPQNITFTEITNQENSKIITENVKPKKSKKSIVI